MADRIDMSLDDIIRRNRGQFNVFRGRGVKSFRGRGSRGMGMRRGGAKNANVRSNFNKGNFSFKGNFARTNQNFVTTNRFRRGGLNVVRGAPAKLLISNLHYGVSDSDVKELFTEFGALRKAVVHYDQSGRSLGTADVVFERRMDAIRAMNRYNGVPLDGRAMKIQITSAGNPRVAMQQNRFSGRGRGTRGRGRGFQRT